jgi:large subunit ribosomal protein L29
VAKAPAYKTAFECTIMKASELRGMGDEQLSMSLKDEVKNLFHLRFQSATDRLETPSEIKKSRRTIARILTVLRQHELAKASATAKEKI